MAIRPDDAFANSRPPRGSWRLSFRFDGYEIELARRERIAKLAPGAPPPQEQDTQQSGAWLDLVDGGGRVLFRRVLHDPFSTVAEHHSPDGAIEAVRRPPGRGEFEVVVPELPEAAAVSVWSSPVELDRSLEPARELARFDLGEGRPPEGKDGGEGRGGQGGDGGEGREGGEGPEPGLE